ncbi:hypothetical protein TNCV_2675651 [Trichonephila clavipes]|nr:hypothetical protein TNCV_2675651 [Trichonephila clavipes]
MATNRSQEVDRSDLDHITIRTRRVNFKTQDMPLSSSMSPANLSKSSFISPTAHPKQSSTMTISFVPLIYEGLPPCFHRLHSRA